MKPNVEKSMTAAKIADSYLSIRAPTPSAGASAVTCAQNTHRILTSLPCNEKAQAKYGLAGHLVSNCTT